MDGIPFKQTNYSSTPRVCKVPISRESSRTNLSADDTADASGPVTPDAKALEIGFDLVRRSLKLKFEIFSNPSIPGTVC